MDKKINITFGKPDTVKVPVPVRPMSRAEAVSNCVTSICGVAAYGIFIWGVVTFFCGNPFRKKVVVVKQEEKKEE